MTRILRAGDGAVSGVELAGGERIAADAVVCNADLPVAYRTLLGGVEAPAPPAAAATRRRACCGWPASGAARRRAAHHNLHFGHAGTTRSEP